ncbi:DUF1176 domain-containing protein [Stenotrophomonas geniculata]|uniref:DUF1176 domain-containing protein n=1 Tax=Stenotrophomonas geniculata TaxID=86188 RepID=UPI002E795197|nr:DUF1176 domain-containing protein [Stenotrophomonas geniculata]
MPAVPNHPKLPMRSARRVSLLVLAWPLASEAMPSPKHLEFHHLDWFVACDNTRTCRAVGYPADEEGTLSVQLTRKGGPGQAIQGRLSLQPAENQAQPKGALRLHIQQQDVGVLAPTKGKGTHILNATQTSALLSALVRDGGISVTDAAGHRWPLSDKGAAAVLLKIDEHQGRLGTPGAVMRKGSLPETRVPAAPPMPVVRKPTTPNSNLHDPALARLAISPALRSALLTTPNADGCEGLMDADADSPLSNSPLKVHRLDAQHVLVSVPCWRAAYNFGDGYWIARTRAPFRPQLVTDEATGYDNGQITASKLGRSLGDCIWSATWTWNGTAFVATSEMAVGLCRGVPGDTWELPRLVSEIR